MDHKPGSGRLHPDDLAALAEALERGPIRLPHTSPEVPTGLDGKVLNDVVRALIAERVAAFLTREQIGEMIADQLARIGLLTDREHIEETGNAIRGAMKWHKRLDRVISGIALSLLTAAAYAVLRLLGFNLPTPGGQG